MSGSAGFQYDLGQLSKVANIDVPYIATTCSQAEATMQGTAWTNNSEMFDENLSSLYLDNGVATAFTETGADLENLLDALSSSLSQCSTALNAILRRYEAADGLATQQSNMIAAALNEIVSVP
jgi:hypothetical protein